MRSVTVHEAKTHLSRLLERAANGEEITITNRSVPVATLKSVRARKRRAGFLPDPDKMTFMSDDFDAPIPGMEAYR